MGDVVGSITRLAIAWFLPVREANNIIGFVTVFVRKTWRTPAVSDHTILPRVIFSKP